MTRKLVLIPTLVLVSALAWVNWDRLFPAAEIPPQENHETQYVPPPVRVEGADLRRLELLASLAAAPGQGAPAALPWYAMFQIGSEKLYPLENLLASDPTLFLEMCLHRYEQEVQGYKLIFNKRERMAGKLKAPESVECHFREKPFSVHMNWLVKGDSAAAKVLYIEGENKNQMRCRSSKIGLNLFLVSRAIDCAESKNSGRYTIDQFGFYHSTKRSLGSMRDAQARGALFIKYAGMVQLKEVGDRTCYKFIRSPYSPLEEEGINELVIYIDTENWLQVGSVLRDAKGDLIAEYYFRDIQFNPQFKSNQFTDKAL